MAVPPATVNQRLAWPPPIPSHTKVAMTHLNAIAAASTARFWWRGHAYAARWRDW